MTSDKWVIEVWYDSPKYWRVWWEATSNAFMKPTALEWCISLLSDRKNVYDHLKMEEYRFVNVLTGESIPAAVLGL